MTANTYETIRNRQDDFSRIIRQIRAAGVTSVMDLDTSLYTSFTSCLYDFLVKNPSNSAKTVLADLQTSKGIEPIDALTDTYLWLFTPLTGKSRGKEGRLHVDDLFLDRNEAYVLPTLYITVTNYLRDLRKKKEFLQLPLDEPVFTGKTGSAKEYGLALAETISDDSQLIENTIHQLECAKKVETLLASDSLSPARKLYCLLVGIGYKPGEIRVLIQRAVKNTAFRKQLLSHIESHYPVQDLDSLDFPAAVRELAQLKNLSDLKLSVKRAFKNGL